MTRHVRRWVAPLALAGAVALLLGGGAPAVILMDDIDQWRADFFCGNPAVRDFLQGPKLEGGAAGITVFDSRGTAYMACETFIQVVTKDGQARILTGAPEICGNTDGPPGKATFGNAIDLALATDDLLYVVDAANFTLRKVERKADGVWYTETVAGVPGVNGHRDGPGRQALFTNPFESITIDEKGVVYLLGGDWLRKFEKGVVTTLNGGSGYRNGPLKEALFQRTQGRQHGMTYDGKGNLYIADKVNMAIRKVDLAKQEVTTIAGTLPGVEKTRPRDGPALEARFHPGGGPNMIFYNATYDCLIARSDDEQSIRIIKDGWVKTFGPAPGRREGFVGPWRSVAGGVPCGIDRDGNVYVMDERCIRVVRKVEGTNQ